MERTDLPPKDAVRYEIPLSFSEAHVTVSRLGEDVSLLFSGG